MRSSADGYEDVRKEVRHSRARLYPDDQWTIRNEGNIDAHRFDWWNRGGEKHGIEPT